MGKKGRQKTNVTVGVLLVAGSVASIILIGTFVLAHLMLTQRLNDASIDFSIPIILMMASTLGVQTLMGIGKQPVLLLGFVVAFIITMVTGGLLIDGSFVNVLPNLGAIVLGSVVSFTICLKGKRKKIGKYGTYR